MNIDSEGWKIITAGYEQVCVCVRVCQQTAEKFLVAEILLKSLLSSHRIMLVWFPASCQPFGHVLLFLFLLLFLQNEENSSFLSDWGQMNQTYSFAAAWG